MLSPVGTVAQQGSQQRAFSYYLQRYTILPLARPRVHAALDVAEHVHGDPRSSRELLLAQILLAAQLPQASNWTRRSLM